MKTEEFLKILRDKLSILEESEIDDIISEYKEHIEEKKKTKKKEEKIIEEFGNIDELAREILKAYKINDEYNSKSDFNNTIKKWFNKFEEVINKIVKILTTASAGEIIKFIIEIFIICVLIALMKIPFEFVEHLLGNLFIYLPDPFSDAFNHLLRFLTEVSYVIIAFLTFIVIFKERYLDNDETFEFKTERKNVKELKENKEIKNEKISAKTIRRNKGKTEKRERSNAAFDSLANILVLFVKLLIVLICIPFLFTFIVSISGLIMSIMFSIKYITVIGIIIAMVGVVLAHYWIITIFYNIIFNKNSNGKLLFLLFIVSFALIGSGIGYSILEIGDLNILDMNRLSLEYTTKDYEYDLNNILHDYNKELDIDFRSDYDSVKINTVIDNTLGDKVLIKVKYYDKLTRISLHEFNHYDDYADIQIYSDLKGREIFNFTVNSLKNKRIYDLSSLKTYITVYVSEDNANKINY